MDERRNTFGDEVENEKPKLEKSAQSARTSQTARSSPRDHIEKVTGKSSNLIVHGYSFDNRGQIQKSSVQDEKKLEIKDIVGMMNNRAFVREAKD